ncbi:MAG: tetratricopeptide repeat protein [Candidatus Acidiferrum sp.]
MRTKVTATSIIFLSLLVFSSPLAPQTSAPPLTKLELLAIVAGEIMPENVVYDLRSRGVDFVPDDAFRSLLKSAGADDRIMQALHAAKVDSARADEDAGDTPLLQHLSHAGSLIRAGKPDDAAEELTSSFAGGRGKSAIGFVVGDILGSRNRFPEASQIYSEILDNDPDFPEVHTRLSWTSYQVGGAEETLRQAKAALLENPNNPVAHLNAGLALDALQHFDAAKEEYQKAVRCKPDYALAYMNFGNLLAEVKDYDGAIAQFKSALTLDPTRALTHYNIGIVYADKKDFVSAIREFREAKRLDPHMLDARQNLGSALMQTDAAAAITEFKELAAIAPDWPLCHLCLGSAYLRIGRSDEAEKEYTLAIQQNPGSTEPLNGLGAAFETEKKYDDALVEYRLAEKLDSTDFASFLEAGRVLLLKKDFPAATSELRQAEQLSPADWQSHDFLGQALEASGDRKAAIAEYKQAVTLSPKELQARLDLALALEKSGDWVSSLDNYRQAAVDEPPPIPDGVPRIRYDAQNHYISAQQRFQQHLADLRATGKESEADSLEALLKQREAAPNYDEKFHFALAKSKQAAQERRFDDAETSAKEAVSIAEKIQPQDGRLAEAVGQLGSVYAFRRDFSDASTQFQRQLAVAEQFYGPHSPMLVDAFQNLGMTAMEQNDLASSEKDFNQSLDLIRGTYGENSPQAAMTLLALSRIYFLKKDYPKAEGYVLHYVKNYELESGETDYRMLLPVNTLCMFYDQTANPEKSAACHARMVSLGEKRFGADSPLLMQDLTAEAQALRKLGRNDEAAKLEKRTQSLQSAQTNPN